MRFGLDAEQRDLRATARQLLATRLPTLESSSDPVVTQELWTELCDAGWPGVAVPAAQGGADLGLLELCLLLEEVGASRAPVPLLGTAACAMALAHAGSDSQRGDWLPALAEGKVRGAIGTRGRDGVAFVVDGPHADVVVVLDADGAELVEPARVPGALEAVETMDTLSGYGLVAVRGEPLPGDASVVRAAAAIAASAELVGLARRALEMAVEYVKRREQFGRPVGQFQAVAHRCADMLRATEKARISVHYAAWAFDSHSPDAEVAASVAKAVASAAAVQVTGSAIQAHGGIGFTWEAQLHWLYKRAHVLAGSVGGAGEHRERIGRLVLPSVS